MISTATPPALLDNPGEAEKTFECGSRDVRPIIADDQPPFQVLKQLEIESIGKQDDTALAE